MSSKVQAHHEDEDVACIMGIDSVALIVYIIYYKNYYSKVTDVGIHDVYLTT
jgi:hypothetical protein